MAVQVAAGSATLSPVTYKLMYELVVISYLVRALELHMEVFLVVKYFLEVVFHM